MRLLGRGARSDDVGDPETLLEIGLIAAGLVLAGGVALLLAGQASGRAKRGARHAEGPPAPGSASSDRHQHVQTSSSR
jgi:hypothetical protein